MYTEDCDALHFLFMLSTLMAARSKMKVVYVFPVSTLWAWIYTAGHLTYTPEINFDMCTNSTYIIFYSNAGHSELRRDTQDQLLSTLRDHTSRK